MSTPSQPRAPRPFWVSLAFALVWAGLASFCWQYGRLGHTGPAIFTLILSLMTLAQISQGLSDLSVRRRRKKLMKESRKNSNLHGKARFADEHDLKKAGLFRPKGLYLGRFRKRKIYYSGETHLLTIAPPGAGKGTSIVVPNLLSAKRRFFKMVNNLSVIVADPKAELWAISSWFRENILGHRIIVLCPWAKEMSAALGKVITDHGFNPYCLFEYADNIKDAAKLISSLLLPGKAQMSQSDEFWNDGGRGILTTFSLFLYYKFGRVDLPMIRKHLLAPPEIMFDTLDEMSGCMAFEGAIAEYGGKLLGALKNSPQQFEGWLGTAQKALEIYESGSPLGDHVSRGELDFASLKDHPTTIYVIMPSDRAGTHAAWLNMVMSLGIEQVGRDRSNRRVLFLLDEFANIGYLPNVLRGMAQYRGQGVQVWAVIQQISQLTRLYGENGMRDIIGMAEVTSTFGIWEPQTLKMISEWMGSRTIRNYGQNVTPAVEKNSFGFNYSASDQGVPLMRPEEIRTMPSEDQLIFYKNLSPIRAQKVPYFRDRSFRTKAQANPYLRYKCERKRQIMTLLHRLFQGLIALGRRG